MSLLYPVFAMSFTSYELSSWHPDPEAHLQPFDPDPTYCHPHSPSYDPDYEPYSRICIRTSHSAYMPECVARLLHDIQVRKELDSYDLGITPESNYEVYRLNDDYVIPF